MIDYQEECPHEHVADWVPTIEDADVRICLDCYKIVEMRETHEEI